MEGWTLSTNYITEIFHRLRDKFYFRAFVDELVKTDNNADSRNLESVKRLTTAFMKLLFPHITNINEIDKEEFKKYCLEPAMMMREDVLKQLRIQDSEYDDKKMPQINL